MKIQCVINGQPETVTISSTKTLLDMLRDDLNLTGTKEGCNEGECGACIVLLDKAPVNSCLVLAAEANGREIVTIEGIGMVGDLHPLQEAFLRHQAVQCGFCTSGIIMNSLAFLAQTNNPSGQQIRASLGGNLCRCTGYHQIVDAIDDAAKQMAKDSEVQS